MFPHEEEHACSDKYILSIQLYSDSYIRLFSNNPPSLQFERIERIDVYGSNSEFFLNDKGVEQ
jgi:hypothetical protein